MLDSRLIFFVAYMYNEIYLSIFRFNHDSHFTQDFSVPSITHKRTFVSNLPIVPVHLQLEKSVNYAIHEDTRVSVVKIYHW